MGAFAVTSWVGRATSSSAVYRTLATSASDSPTWFQQAVGAVAELGLLALVGLWVLHAWRALRAGRVAATWAVLTGVGAVVAYLGSEGLKVVLRQPRPCADLTVAVLAECPGPGDWSLPSNHATIAAALAAAVVLMSPRPRRVAVIAGAVALAVAAARVGTGVHYPHDVVTGLLLGTLVVPVVTLALSRLAHTLRGAAAQRVRTRGAHG